MCGVRFMMLFRNEGQKSQAEYEISQFALNWVQNRVLVTIIDHLHDLLYMSRVEQTIKWSN